MCLKKEQGMCLQEFILRAEQQHITTGKLYIFCISLKKEEKIREKENNIKQKNLITV